MYICIHIHVNIHMYIYPYIHMYMSWNISLRNGAWIVSCTSVLDRKANHVFRGLFVFYSRPSRIRFSCFFVFFRGRERFFRGLFVFFVVVSGLSCVNFFAFFRVFSWSRTLFSWPFRVFSWPVPALRLWKVFVGETAEHKFRGARAIKLSFYVC